MDIATLIVHTLFYLLIGAVNFTLIGKQPEGENRHTGASVTAFVYGAFTIAFMLWWDTPDMASTIAKYGMVAFMWLPWLLDLKNLNKPYHVFTTRQVVLASLFIAARIGVVLAFWH